MKSRRTTKQKIELLEFLKKNANKHLSAQEIKQKLGEDIGLTTIYRMLNELIKNDQIVKIPLENSQGACYQYEDNQKHYEAHYHLICESCKELIHFENEKMLKILEEMEKETEFKINEKKVTFYGRCAKCN